MKLELTCVFLLTVALGGKLVKCLWLDWTPDAYAATGINYINKKRRENNFKPYAGRYKTRKTVLNQEEDEWPEVFPFHPDNTSMAWITSYDGRAFDVELIFIVMLPVWIAVILGFIVNICRSCRKHHTAKPLRPRVPLVKLQQSNLEQKLSKPTQIGIDWYERRFVIRVNDRYIDIASMMQSDREEKSSGQYNPWQLARKVPKWIGWYWERHRRSSVAQSTLDTDFKTSCMRKLITRVAMVAQRFADSEDDKSVKQTPSTTSQLNMAEQPPPPSPRSPSSPLSPLSSPACQTSPEEKSKTTRRKK